MNNNFYIDEVKGMHSSRNCYNPQGHSCGDCKKISCKGCKYENFISFKEYVEKIKKMLKDHPDWAEYRVVAMEKWAEGGIIFPIEDNGIINV